MPTGSDVLTRVATILQDEEHVRWPLPELCRWLNDAVKAILIAKPSANTQSVVLSMAVGTLQSLSNANHLALLRVTRNITGEGPPRVGGRIIRPTSREALDTAEPNWHDPNEVRQAKEVRQYVYDEANPREFFVYPGNDGTGKIEAQVSVLPTPLAVGSGDPDDIASYGGSIGLLEPWGVPVQDYILFRAYSKDAIGADAGRSQAHFNAFAATVGIKVQAESSNSPNSRARVATT